MKISNCWADGHDWDRKQHLPSINFESMTAAAGGYEVSLFGIFFYIIRIIDVIFISTFFKTHLTCTCHLFSKYFETLHSLILQLKSNITLTLVLCIILSKFNNITSSCFFYCILKITLYDYANLIEIILLSIIHGEAYGWVTLLAVNAFKDLQKSEMWLWNIKCRRNTRYVSKFNLWRREASLKPFLEKYKGYFLRHKCKA